MESESGATLYVRASIPKRTREHVYDVVDDLESLEAAETVEEVRVESWDARVPLDADRDRIRTDALDAYEAFREWAADADRSLTPYFRERETEQGTVLVLPIMCLAVESDEGVEAVYPSESESGKQTVLDGLEALRERKAVAAD